MRRHDMKNHLNSSDNIGKHLMKLTSVIAEKDVTMKERHNVHRLEAMQ